MCVNTEFVSKSVVAAQPAALLSQWPELKCPRPAASSRSHHISSSLLKYTTTQPFKNSCHTHSSPPPPPFMNSTRPLCILLSFIHFYFAQLQLQKTQYLQLGQSRGQCYGGSLPNVNQIGTSNTDLPFQVSF